MRPLIIIFVLVFALSGCDTISEMLEEKQKAEAYIKDNFGWESQVGFNYTNGELVDVTLILNSKNIERKTVTELDKIAQQMVSNIFEKKAGTIYLQIVVQPK